MEQRPRLEMELAGLRAVDLGAGQVGGQQVGRELDALKLRFEARCQLLDRRGLGQTRGAFDQQVAVGQQRDQQPIDQGRLPQYAALEMLAQAGQGLGVGTGRVCRRGVD